MINIEKAVAALLSGETRFDTIYGAEFVFYIPAGRASSQRMRLQLQARVLARSLSYVYKCPMINGREQTITNDSKTLRGYS